MVVRGLFAILLLLAMPAFAEDSALPIARFEPVLGVDEDPDLCAGFHTAWLTVFRSYGALSEDRLDLRAALPQAHHFTFPTERQNLSGELAYTGLYDSSYAERIDFDGDGEAEVLFAEAYQIGWRYLGAHLYVFETDEFDDLLAKIDAADLRAPFNLGYYSGTIDGIPAPLLRLRPGPAVIHVFSIGQRWFATASPHADRLVGFRNAVDLIHLNGAGGPQVACRVELLPEADSLSPVIAWSRYLQGLYAIYGGPDPGCMGTMGWTAEPLEEQLLTAVHRPWRMATARPGDLVVQEIDASDVAWNRSASQAREIKYLGWGISDPVSWKRYLDYRAGWPAFRKQLVAHYRNAMGMQSGRAEHFASLAYRFLADRIIYSSSFDHDFTGVTQRIQMHADNGRYPYHDKLRLDEGSTPREVTEAVARLWLQHRSETVGEQPKDGPAPGPEGWQRLLMALLYSGADEALIDRVQAVAERMPIDAGQRIEFANQRLIAAIGDPTQMKNALRQGADVNAGTNWFGKTPLMYAAQIDQLEATRMLIASGAAVDMPTLSDAICRNRRLDRDHRTALMYAAENASPELIELLLDAGANPATVDTQGNDALWYLARNDKLDISERGQLRRLLLIGR